MYKRQGAHDALKQCQTNVNDGYVYVVDMDLETVSYTHLRRWGGECCVWHKVSLKYEKCEVFTTTIRGKLINYFKRQEHMLQLK